MEAKLILKFRPLGPPTSAAYDFNVSLCSCDNDGEDSHKKHLQEMFNRLAGKDKEIDAEELQDILTISLKQGTQQPHNSDLIWLAHFSLQISL